MTKRGEPAEPSANTTHKSIREFKAVVYRAIVHKKKIKMDLTSYYM